MSLINIKIPVSLKMEIVEIDNRLPSFKMEVELNVHHPTGKISYYADDIWFDCLAWDDFISNLQINKRTTVKLENMSNNFRIEVSGESGKFALFCEEMNIGNGGISSVLFSAPIDDDGIAHIKGQFLSFEKWW